MPAPANTLSAKLHTAQCYDLDDARRLRLLLTPEKPTRPVAAAHTRKNSAISDSRSSRAPSTTSRAGSKTSYTASTNTTLTRPPPRSAKSESDSGPLLPSERHHLAIEAVNGCLRVLSAAGSARVPAAQPLDSTTQSRAATQVNRHKAKAQSVGSAKIHAGEHAELSKDNLWATAEIGSVAFEYLQSPEAERHTTSAEAAAAAGLQGGLIAFVGRLLGLGLNDLALRQLRALKKVLQKSSRLATSTHPAPPRPSSNRTNSSPTDDRDTLASLLRLDLGDAADTAPFLGNVVAYQLLVLRLIAAVPKATVFNTILQYLEPSYEHSPVTNLVRLYEIEPTNKHNLIQLESLALILWDSARKLSACETSDFPRASLSLKMIALTLRIRLIWFGLCDHEYDFQKDIAEPFTRAIAKYVKADAKDPMQKYKLARRLHQEILQQAADTGADSGQEKPPNPDALIVHLSRLAQDAGLFNEAHDLSKSLTDHSDVNGKVSAAEFVETARLAAFALSNQEHSEWHHIDLAAQVLSAGISDEASALSIVMHEARKLRDAAYLFIRKALMLWLKNKDEQLQKSVAVAYQVLVSIQMLLARILCPGDDVYVFQDKQILAAWRLLKPSLDAVCNVTKKLVPLGWAPPELLLQAIALCRYLLDAATGYDASPDNPMTTDEVHAFRVDLAKSTWYLVGDQANQTVQALQSLKLGLSILQSAESSTQREGEEALGHYRLGRVLQKLNRREDAKLSFEEAVRSCLRSGVVEDASLKAKSTGIGMTIKSDSNVRVLQAGLKVLFEQYLDQADMDDFDPFTGSISNDTEQVAYFYEIWLSLLCNQIMPKSASFKAFDAASEIARRLLEIYKKNSFPLRRCRLLSKLIRLRAERKELKNIVDFQDVEDMLSFSGNLSNDDGLSSFWDHHVSSLASAYGLLRGSQGVRQLENALETWTGIIRGASSWSDIERRIDDPESFMAQVGAIANFMDTQGLDEHRAQALALLASAEALSSDGALIRKTPRTVDVAAHLSQLGYTNEAGRYLDVGNILMGMSGGANLQADLVRALWLLARNESEKAEEILIDMRKTIVSEGEGALAAFDVPVTLPSRLRQIIGFCDVLYTHAEWSLQTRGCGEALLFAKRATTLLDHAWKSLEAKQRQKTTPDTPAVDELDALAAGLSRLSFSKASDLQSAVDDVHEFRGPLFWPVAGRLFRALLQLTKICKLFGAQQAATSAAEQAYRLAKAVRSRPFIARSLLERGDIAWRRGDYIEAKELLDSARSLYSKFQRPTWEHMALQCSYANLFRSQGDLEKENTAYERALGALSIMKDPAWLLDIQQLPPLSVPAENDNDSSFGDLSETEIVETSSPAKSAKQWIEQQQQHHIKLDVGRLTPTPISRQPLVGFEVFSDPFKLQRNHITFQKAEVLLLSDQLDACEQLITSLAISDGPAEYRARQNALQALLRLHEAIAELSTHAVFGMLPESTLALPAIPLLDREHALDDMNEQRSPVKIKAVIAGHARAGSKATSIGQLASVQTLQKTIASITKLSVSSLYLCSNASISRLQEILTSASILLAAAAQGQAPQHPALLAYNLDLPKSFSAVRSQAALDAELALKNIATQFEFPDAVSGAKAIRESTSRAPEFDLANALPTSWTVLSFNLREADGYLFITKYAAGRTPFILRLPLQRQSGDELEEDESFSFEEAYSELGNIIQASDDAVHLARDNPDALKVKGSKTQWWEEREALDARLGNLLTNIETLWFGGFRGIFAQSTRQPQTIERFRHSFESCLAKHLPSRQLQGKRQRNTTVKLDDNILELFLGLVSIQKEEAAVEIDEALHDLLYFVVDILQFNGESNAYDEIDFDAMIVELQEALEEHRHRLLAASMRGPTPDHVILILDKKLHRIPWESMPCLAHRSVSRLPSLIELRDRILFLQTQSSSHGEGIQVSLRNGTYFLNPGSDLPSTQARFEKALYTLATQHNWKKLVNQAPSEEDFSAALVRGLPSSSSAAASASSASSPHTPGILLYIGHGGGTQYIRQRTIQRLRPLGCNIPLLFGCSSAGLTEQGEFEASGIPRSYLLAGAPAMLGSLWDVTDGDLDLCAKATLEGWALLGKSAADQAAQPDHTCEQNRDDDGQDVRKTKKPTRKKSRREIVRGASTSEDDEDDGNEGGHAESKSLGLALARARRRCYLRYLNGAAMVVYGVPVYLDAR